ncbi:MAG TPA: hypothetical protein VN428_12310 [Bryobacteraceae bacterium]|nr:hypothetical protein [Bryobacteraceae bacterium]
MAVHAGSHIRTRTMALDRALLGRPRELARIFVHELFHFAWIHLSNAERRSWQELLSTERGSGELGWSAEMRKLKLQPSDGPNRTRRWREYSCESFCDTAAWLFAGAARHEEFTLAARWRERRKRWFRRFLGNALQV